MKIMPKVYLLLVFLTLSACGGGGGGGSGGNRETITITWEEPEYKGYGEDVTITGYRIYYGEEEDSLDHVIEVESSSTSYSVTFDTDLVDPSTRVYVAVSAMNSNNLESKLSNVITN